jgi:glycosyltransferase involved in cell wall biosynthesis
MEPNRVAIIGSVGIPSKYGGFETLVEYLTKYLGEELLITVYCSSKAYDRKLAEYNNALLKYVPFKANGIQSIPYDIISLFRSAKKHDTILILGVSGCIILPVFNLLFPKKKLLINVDGLEHKRAKWKKSIRNFLKYSERLAVRYGHQIIADNKAIQEYLRDEYEKDSTLIAYGGDHTEKQSLTIENKEQFSLPSKYAVKICRIEPENNIDLILEAFTGTAFHLIIIGNWMQSDYGKNLKQRFSSYKSISLLDPIYNQKILDQIRSNSTLYLHGHSAGGTNPSLVEAMFLGLPVFAYDVSYNRETTQNQACYFRDGKELENLINSKDELFLKELGLKMKEIAEVEYTWEKITQQYYELLLLLFKES